MRDRDRLSRALAILGALILATVLAQRLISDSDSTKTATSTTRVALAAKPPQLTVDGEFRRCALGRRAATFSAGGWGGSVAGDIGCDEAGRLIQRYFNRDFGQTKLVGSQAEEIRGSDPGRFKSAGYDCAAFPLPDDFGWHMLCTRGANQVSFYFTP